MKLKDGGTVKKITSSDYGRKVSYKDENGNQVGNRVWRLFYVDDEDPDEDGKGYFGDNAGTIYLKADTTKADTVPTLTFNSSTTLVRQLNPIWANGETSNTDSIKRGEISETSWYMGENAAAWFCDPSVWNLAYKSKNSIYDGEKINWVIGALPIEMLLKSYENVTSHKEEYIPGYQGKTSSTFPGYIFYHEDKIVSNMGYIDSKIQNGLYCRVSNTNSINTWISSPIHTTYSGCLSINCYTGGITGRFVNNNAWKASIAPVVSISSEVTLEEIE